MRHLLAVLALTGALLPAAALPVQAAPSESHFCPTEARGTVTHNGDASWVATNQASRLSDLRIAPIGGVVALVCVYQMFGGEYWIYKHPSAQYANCEVITTGDGRRGFYCLATS